MGRNNIRSTSTSTSTSGTLHKSHCDFHRFLPAEEFRRAPSFTAGSRTTDSGDTGRDAGSTMQDATACEREPLILCEREGARTAAMRNTVVRKVQFGKCLC
jgi:hypothetical protein